MCPVSIRNQKPAGCPPFSSTFPNCIIVSHLLSTTDRCISLGEMYVVGGICFSALMSRMLLARGLKVVGRDDSSLTNSNISILIVYDIVCTGSKMKPWFPTLHKALSASTTSFYLFLFSLSGCYPRSHPPQSKMRRAERQHLKVDIEDDIHRQ